MYVLIRGQILRCKTVTENRSMYYGRKSIYIVSFIVDRDNYAADYTEIFVTEQEAKLLVSMLKLGRSW